MIDVTGINLVRFAQKVYELSSPQGLGFMHFTPQPLDEKVAQEMVDQWKKDNWSALSMDYVNGRACKMDVIRKDGKLFIHDSWYDHSDDKLKQLLAAFNVSLEKQSAHNLCCNCPDCQSKQARASG